MPHDVFGSNFDPKQLLGGGRQEHFLGSNSVLVAVGCQESPSEDSCLWSSSLQAEPKTEIQVHMTYGERALRGREWGRLVEGQVAKPGSMPEKDLGLILRRSGCNSPAQSPTRQGARFCTLRDLLATVT